MVFQPQLGIHHTGQGTLHNHLLKPTNDKLVGGFNLPL